MMGLIKISLYNYMKTITRNIELYEYDELNKEAQEKALAKWKEGNDYFFLEDCMNERLHELLEEKGIKDLNGEYDVVNQKRPENKGKVLYSLSYCQGDGAMFTGEFEFASEVAPKVNGQWKKYTAYVTHSGRYYHSNSKLIEIHESENLGFDIGEDYQPKIYAEFEGMYKDICKELERFGYNFIEHEDSEESFSEECEANGYTFLSNGVMENE